jgi:hypothetical protein
MSELLAKLVLALLQNGALYIKPLFGIREEHLSLLISWLVSPHLRILCLIHLLYAYLFFSTPIVCYFYKGAHCLIFVIFDLFFYLFGDVIYVKSEAAANTLHHCWYRFSLFHLYPPSIFTHFCTFFWPIWQILLQTELLDILIIEIIKRRCLACLNSRCLDSI